MLNDDRTSIIAKTFYSYKLVNLQMDRHIFDHCDLDSYSQPAGNAPLKQLLNGFGINSSTDKWVALYDESTMTSKCEDLFLADITLRDKIKTERMIENIKKLGASLIIMFRDEPNYWSPRKTFVSSSCLKYKVH